MTEGAVEFLAHAYGQRTPLRDRQEARGESRARAGLFLSRA